MSLATSAPRYDETPEFPGRIATILSSYSLSESAFINKFSAFRSILKKHGASATVPITSVLLERHPRFIRKFRKSMEFTMYGHLYNDYSKMPYDTMQRHLAASVNSFSRYNIKPRGFRSPFFLWNDKILETLVAHDFLYESNDALLWEGAVSVKKPVREGIRRYFQFKSTREMPSMPVIEKGIVRVPVSLPNDQLLYHLWNVRDPELASHFLLAMLRACHDRGELVTFDFHMEYWNEFSKSVEKLLSSAKKKSPPVWVATLAEVSKWWLERSKLMFDLKERRDCYELVSDCPSYGTILVRGAGTDARMEAWAGRYKSVRKNRFMVKSARIPGIGVAPGTPSKLVDFLKSEGFIVDESTGRDRFAIYIDDIYRFENGEGDGLRLLKRIESTYAPIVRLWRWPNRARCAMSLTFDVEAITLGDFLRRKKEK